MMKHDEPEATYYHLSCPECGNLWWSKEAFPDKCPKCGADRKIETCNHNLNVYFVMFAVKKGTEWNCYAGYVFAKKKEDVYSWLTKKYGEVTIRLIEQKDVEEGTILYGERWMNF